MGPIKKKEKAKTVRQKQTQAKPSNNEKKVQTIKQIDKKKEVKKPSKIQNVQDDQLHLDGWNLWKAMRKDQANQSEVKPTSFLGSSLRLCFFNNS